MKNFIATLLVLAAGGAASPVAAQDGHQPAGTSPRPVLRRPAEPRAARPAATYEPAAPAPRYEAAGRTIELFDLAANVLATVQLARWVRNHPDELLLPPGTCRPAADQASARRPARRPGPNDPATGRFGLKAGLNRATVAGTRFVDTKYVWGFNAGFMADFGLGEHFAFHPELLYSQKGAKGSYLDPSGAGLSEEERTHYLDLPLLLRARAGGFFFEAGPQLGYLLAQKSTFTTTLPGYAPEVSTVTGTDGSRRLDLGYVLGLGYALPQGWEIGLRYNGGLADVQDPSADPKLRNSVFQLQAGYLF
jgi:hypothetical protein